jgi:hypothetical protein
MVHPQAARQALIGTTRPEGRELTPSMALQGILC